MGAIQRRLAVCTGVITLLAAAPWTAAPVYAGEAAIPPMIVTTTLDGLNVDSNCTLREAVTNANNNDDTYPECGDPGTASPDIINLFSSANYTLTIAGQNEDANATGDLDILSDIRIDSPFGPSLIRASTTGGDAGAGIDRVFHVMNNRTLTTIRVWVTNGRSGGTGAAPRPGGGILADPGNVSMTNGAVLDNRTGGGAGGGIYVNGSLTLHDVAVEDNKGSQGGGIYKTGAGSLTISGTSSLENNAAESGGGGIYLAGGSASLFHTQVLSNSAAPVGGGSPGGGIEHCSTGTLAITGATFQSNSTPVDYTGGALDTCSTAGATTIDQSRFISNSSSIGGAIFQNSGSLSVDRTSFEQNQAGIYGGAIANFGDGTLTVSRSAFDGNDVSIENGAGGGISNQDGIVTVTNSSFHDNTAFGGGGIANRDVLTVRFSTLSGNTSGDEDTGANVLDIEPGAPSTTTIEASILANPVTGPSCSGSISSGNDNIVEDPGTCAFNGDRDQAFEVGLTSFSNHGGPTDTFALLPDSIAMDTYGGNNCPSVDQRGYTRPAILAPGAADPDCDIGAYEAIVVTVDDESVTEGDPGETPDLMFGLTLPTGAPEEVEITVDFQHDTTQDNDIDSCSPGAAPSCDTVITFSSGDSLSQTVQVEAKGDNIDESNESFFLMLDSAELVLDDGEVEGTIVDDDTTVGHSRSTTLRLRRHLRAKGRVTVPDGFNQCRATVPLKVQKRRPNGTWKTLKTVSTDTAGFYKTKIPDKQGRYRALAPKRTVTTTDIHNCRRAISPKRRHKH